MTDLAAVIHQAAAPRLPPRPYPGLRPFEAKEWSIFFGREEMIDEVIDRLAGQCFVLVHGSSGSGKSSLIRAGVLPRLERQHRRNRFGWSTAEMRPAGGPLWNLAEALAARDRGAADADEVDALRRRFDEQGASLRSIVSDLLDMSGHRLCLLVDQFEELFQYARERSLEEATLFVDLIAAALEDDTGSPLRVILTMRSDYLGECVGWPNLAGAVNRAQYLLPPMGQTALRNAVCRPAELYRGEIDPRLAVQMIADVQGEQDQLPLIQHGLMRLWDLTTVVDGTRRLDMALYEEHGPLTRILDEHADEIARKAEPGNDGLPLVSGIFRALSDLNDAGQPIRRPQTLGELTAVTGASEARVRGVVDAFRADGVSFLRPYGQERLDDKGQVDIAHEALMRCWKRLADRRTGWLWDELRQGLAWKSLLAQADLFHENRRNVLSPPTTEDRARWLGARTEAWAARHGGCWDKVAQLMAASQKKALHLRLVRYSSGAVALLALISVCAGFYMYLRATQALDDLYAEQAKDKWSEINSGSDRTALTPRQQIALWGIASGPPQLRERFVGLLSVDQKLGASLGANGSIIYRALGLTWPQTMEQAQAVLDPLLEAIGKTTDPFALRSLAQAVAALASRLTPEQAQAALGRVLEAIGKTTDPVALGPLGQAVAALAPTPEQAQAALGRVLAAIGKTTDSDQLGSLAQAVAALAPTPEQAQAALGRVLGAIEKTTDSFQLRSLAQAVAALASRLTPEQAQAALGRVLVAIGKTTDRFALGSLVPAVAALAPRLTPEQAQAALGRVLVAIGKTTDSDQLGSLAQAVAALAPRLTPEQAQAALGRVLEAIRKTDPFALGSLAPGVAVTTLVPWVAALAPAVAALALRLTPEQAQAALGRVLEAIGKTTDRFALGSLVPAVAALAPTPEQAQAALGRVLEAIGKTTDSDQLGSLAEQAQAALGRVLGTIGKTTSPSALRSLAQGVVALAPRLTPEQAQAALGRVLVAIGKTTDTDQLGSLVPAVAALAPTPEQAQAALGRVLEAIGKTTDTDQLGSLAQAVAALAPRLNPEQAQAALGRMRSALGWSASVEEAQEWVKAFVALLTRLPDTRSSSQIIVEAMKFPITAGEPSDQLLVALQKHFPSLPGPATGFRANLDWLKRNEPSIDLVGRAVCPFPPREELRCPVQASAF